MTDRTVARLTKQISNMIQALPENSPERSIFVARLLELKADLMKHHGPKVATQNACPPDDDKCRPGDTGDPPLDGG